jgi:hypothetical protein
MRSLRVTYDPLIAATGVAEKKIIGRAPQRPESSLYFGMNPYSPTVGKANL